MQEQNRNQQQPDNIGRMGSEQQRDQDIRETERQQESGNLERTSLDSDEDRDEERGPMAPDETEFGMDKEDYRDQPDTDRSDRRL